MGVSTSDRKKLWTEAGGICAFTGCNTPLVTIDEATGSEVLTGMEAHIVARSPDGPRGVATMTPAERDDYSNILILCREHHAQVDADPNIFTVEVLKSMKDSCRRRHRDSVSSTDLAKEDAEIAALNLVDQWSQKANLDEWSYWAMFRLPDCSSGPRQAPPTPFLLITCSDSQARQSFSVTTTRRSFRSTEESFR
jgi:hypothetical protein